MRDWDIRAPRRYIGASPSHGAQSLGGVHWPTDEEYEALHAAKAIGEQKRGRIPWSVEVKVRNSQFVARVTCEREHGYRTQIVRRSNPDSAGCLNEKSWIGIPVWADQTGPSQIRFIYDDTGLFHGLGDCCGGCRSKQPEKLAMRPYTNAVPQHGYHRNHWPTDAEYTAIQEAEHRCQKRRQQDGGCHIANVRVNDGSGHDAHVFVGAGGDWLSGIWIKAGDRQRFLKSWTGVPKWTEPQRQGGNMKRYPDKYIQGDQIDFRAPPDKHYDVTQHVHFHHRTVINHHRHAPQQIEHGEAGQQTTYLQGVQINMHQAPAERHQQIADRGQVVEVRHQHAALPKPGIRMPGARQLALPAPQQASRGLPAPQQQPMQRVSARASVLEAFARAKR